jgi:hypothetical protein
MARADSYSFGGVRTPPPDEPARLWRPNDDEYEAAHGMEPLRDIHAERGPIADRYAELRPLFGPAKMWEHQRKSLLALISLEARREWTTSTRTAGLKLTEDTVDAIAHHDERYTAFLEEGVGLAVEYERLSVQMGNLEERSQRGQVIGRLRASEMHMTPSGA